MNLNRKSIEKILFIGTVFILIYLGLQNMSVVFQFLSWLSYVLMPFLIGICFTFILNVPLKAIERRLFRPKNGKPVKPILNKLRRPIALTMSIMIFFLVIALILVLVIPEIGKSLAKLAEAVPGTINNVRDWLSTTAEENEFIGEITENVSINWDDVSKYFTSFLQNDAAGVVSYAMGMLSSVFNITLSIFLGLVLSIYTLAKKEKIGSNAKKLIYSIFPTRTADFIVEVGVLTNKSFYNSITGQMMECVILGSLTVLGMTIFNFPYAPLIGVMVAILSWIPMFGVGIGAAIGALFILTVSPIQAIWFIVFMICLQQIEGNLIFPRVVGKNIGLPPILLISAIIIFSNFFGIIGLFVCGPVTYVIYTLLRRFTFKRLRAKKVPRRKYAIRYEYLPGERRLNKTGRLSDLPLKFKRKKKTVEQQEEKTG